MPVGGTAAMVLAEFWNVGEEESVHESPQLSLGERRSRVIAPRKKASKPPNLGIKDAFRDYLAYQVQELNHLSSLRLSCLHDGQQS